MIVLYILLGILLLFSILFSLHLKLYLQIDDETTIQAGLGPIVVQLTPKKKPKTVTLSAFTYKKHQKRLKKERNAARKKAAKQAEKNQKKQQSLSAQAEKAAQTVDQSKDEGKLASVLDILTLLFEELPKLASYCKTEIRMLDITVGGEDADKIARTYGKIASLVSLLLELLDNKTHLKKLKPQAVQVNADFLAEKTNYRIHIRFKLRLFFVLCVGVHALKWYIRLKMRQSKSNS